MASHYWVFLRGLIRQHRHWEDFPQRFKQAMPDAEVILIDLPGNGNLFEHESPTSILGMVESVRKQLDRLSIHSPVNVVALSLGAMTTIEWLERFPGDIERAVLINTSLRGLNSFTERLRPANYPAIVRQLVRRKPLALEQLILDITTNIYPDTDALAAKWAQYAKAQPTSTMNALRQLLAAGLYSAPKARPHEHVLVLQGLSDRLVNPICSQRIAEHYRWPLLSHPDAGHDLTLDDPNWVIDQIKAWINEGQPS